MIQKLEEDSKLSPALSNLEAAGGGFVNASFKPCYWHKELKQILDLKTNYGTLSLGNKSPINIEYVSANPTGPLHAGHGRVAVVADVLANLLVKVGYCVTRQYYVNDTGGQIDLLARSTYLRYCEALNESISEIPEGYYPGEYLKDVANALILQEKDKWLGQPEEASKGVFRDFSVKFLMEKIRKDIKGLGISQDVFPPN